MNLTINPKRVAFALMAGAIILVVLHVLACIPMVLIEEREYPVGILSLDGEVNIPTMYAAILLWLNALILLCIAWATPSGKSGRYHWGGLAFVFLCAGLDESTEIHERCMDVVAQVVDASGIFHFAWVIPYGLAFIVAVLIYLRFYLKLPADTRRLFFVAAALFIGGAVGVEMLSGLIVEFSGKGVLYYIGVTLEESLEMAGSITLIYALCRYIEVHIPGLTLNFSSGKTE